MGSRRPNSSSTTPKNEVNNGTDSIVPRTVENFILIWLDSKTNEAPEEYQDSIHLLKRFVNTILLVSDQGQYADLIRNIKDEKVFIIVSGHFGFHLASQMQKTSKIYSVYVYCNQRQYHEEWAKDFSKIKGVFTAIAPICDALRRDVRQVNNDLIRISILSSLNSDEVDKSFACSLILKHILVNTFDEQTGKEFIKFCRLHYTKNSYESDNINGYKNNNPELSVIQWYTRECFIYSMLNRALRIYDIEILTKIIFFVQQLHRQIEGMHSKSNKQQQLTVYHGQTISNDQFLNLRQSRNSLISFNTFLFTTTDKQVSVNFTQQSLKNDSNLEGVLFKILVDPSTSSCPFVILDKLDYYEDSDQHVLFSLTAVFKIMKCEQMDNGLWQIDLNLIDNNDEKMKTITKWIEKKFGELDGFFRPGQIMIDMGELDRAENVFQMLLRTTKETDIEKFAFIHRKLGQINYDKKEFDTALLYYNQCLEIRSWYRRPDEPSSHSIYTKIGTIQKEQGNPDEALENFQRAMDCLNSDRKPDPVAIATCYNSIGLILMDRHKLSEARKNFEKALEFEE